MATDLDPLLHHARQRGFRRWIAVAIGLVGAIPAIAVAAVPRVTTGSWPFIATLAVFGPAALLILWTYRDPEGRAARELSMWVSSLRRAMSDDGTGLPLDELPETPPPEELDRVAMKSMAAEYREVLEPLVTNRNALYVRIAIYRWWYPALVMALAVVALLAFAAFTLVTPACAPSSVPGAICH